MNDKYPRKINKELPSEIFRAASQFVSFFSYGWKAPDRLCRLGMMVGREERTEPLLGLVVGSFNDL